MKKLALFLFTTILFLSCKTEKKEEAKIEQNQKLEIAPVSSEMMETAVIYEANIRQYSKEGTFEAFTKDIPEIKKLGVKVIWLMPIFPISRTKRKATGGDFASIIKDDATRNKMLGSYYAASDFTKINPEFGTIEDFRELLNTAHNNGIYVILDWVPNHTGWDHPWLKTNPEFYTKNAKGEITDPLHEDGTSKGYGDVAQLDYSNELLQEIMIKDMLYWVEKENVDGFRCDHVGPVPMSFWENAISQLRKKRNVFMLAESEEAKYMTDNLFDMGYGWETHNIMNDIAKGEKSVKDWDDLIVKQNTKFEDDDILMNFITNHDENSWNGTVSERMGNASEIMLALSYVAPGMPLIYTGQEYDLNHRLKFFEKDSIPKTKGKVWPLLEKLGKLKNTNPALNGGKYAATYSNIDTKNNSVLIFNRENNSSMITFIGNLSNKEQTIENKLKGKYLDYMVNDYIEFKSKTITFNPWEYKILISKIN